MFYRSHSRYSSTHYLSAPPEYLCAHSLHGQWTGITGTTGKQLATRPEYCLDNPQCASLFNISRSNSKSKCVCPPDSKFVCGEPGENPPSVLCVCLKTSDVKVETIDSKSGSVPNVARMLQSSDITCKKKTVSIQGSELLNTMLVDRGAGWRNGEQVTNFSCDKNGITKEEPVIMRNYMQEGVNMQIQMHVACKMTKSLRCESRPMSSTQEAFIAAQRMEQASLTCTRKSSIVPVFGNCEFKGGGSWAPCSSELESWVSARVKEVKGTGHCTPYGAQW